MPRQKLLQILRAKSSFTEAEIAQLSDHAGWSWVYTNLQPKKKLKTGPEICFTGFSLADKNFLSSQAALAGLHVVGSVTKRLFFLCAGDNPGASKLQRAQVQNVQILNRHQFTQLLETGELP